MRIGRLRIGVIGAGMIAQIEHLPNLSVLRREFNARGITEELRGFQRTVTEGVPLRIAAGTAARDVGLLAGFAVWAAGTRKGQAA